MKTRILAALLILCGIASTAQTRKGLFFNPNFQAGSTGHSNTYMYPDYYTNFGINIGYMFGNRLGMYTGIGLNDYNLIWDDGYSMVTMEHQYLTLPVGVRFVSSKFNKIGFYTDFSLNVSILFDSYIEDVATGINSTSTDGIQTVLSQFQFNPGLYIGVKKRSSFQVGAVLHGTMDDLYTVDDPTVNGYLVAIGLRIGYTLRLTGAK